MQLIKWDEIRTAIETSKDIEQLTAIKDRLRAYQVLAEQSKQSMEVQAKIAIYKARADRKCGEWLKNNVKQGGINKFNKEEGNNIVLSSIGVSKNESSRLQKIADIDDSTFESILTQAETETKKVTSNMLVSISKEMNKGKRVDNERNARGKEIAGLDIRHGDFKEVLSDLKNIDFILTDPPYPFEFIQCFSELSEFASKKLKDDGFIAVYSGQYHLPEVMRRLSEHLTYVWTFCLSHEGKSQLVNGVNIMCGWKPILIFSKGRRKMPFSAYDVVVSESREKHSHEWQQSESGAIRLIETFSKPGELVVDPFSGSGTFVKVAIDMSRLGIGAEIA